MIELDQDRARREPLHENLPALEIYEGLLRCRNRTIRVQESWVEKLERAHGKRNEQVQVNYEYRLFKDQVGVLTRLHLKHSEFFYPNGEESPNTNAFFSIFLDGDKLNDFKLKRARIQVLQEDSGNWELLFQGTEWAEYNRNYLRIYS